MSVSHLINFFSFLSFFTFSSLLVVISVCERIQTDDGRNPPTTTDETHHRRLLHLLRQKKDRNPPQSTNELFSVKILREAKRITEEASQVLREVPTRHCHFPSHKPIKLSPLIFFSYFFWTSLVSDLSQI